MTAVIGAPASAADFAAIRELFREYVAAPDWEAAFHEYLAQQAFEEELNNLPGSYAPPGGALILARVDGAAAGCVAFKPLEPPTVCEMKRLYVRPAFRALGLGRALVEAVVAEAAGAGYTSMRLDTLPSMRTAQRLYRNLGFQPIAAYCNNPVPGAVFMERWIGPKASTG